jgi:hypothetical protein
MAIAHAFGFAHDFDLDASAEAFALVCCHFFYLIE